MILKIMTFFLVFSSLYAKAEKPLTKSQWTKIELKYKLYSTEDRISKSFKEALKTRIGINSQKNKNHLYFKKVKVAVIDTGVNIKNPVLSKYKSLRRPASINDKSGHGSHVLGIISLLSDEKHTSITPYNFYKKDHTNQETLKSLLRELRRAIDDKVDIINLSLGGPHRSKEEKRLIDEAERKGIIIVTAAGNNNTNLDFDYCGFNFFSNNMCAKYYPAAYKNKNVISVANYEAKDSIFYGSNYGEETVTLGTLGEKIPSFSKEGVNKFKPTLLTGSSMAAPIITSAIVRLKQRYPYLTLTQVKYILKINSFKDDNTKYGYFDYYSFNNWMNKNYHYYDINPSDKNKGLKSFFKYYIFENNKSDFNIL